MIFPWRREKKMFLMFRGVETNLMIIQGAFALINTNDFNQIFRLHPTSRRMI